MNKSVIVFSITVTAIIFAFFLFSVMAILYFYWGDTSAVKDSLSTISGIFGGITTIGAAVVAAYLFNDWKIVAKFERNKEIINEFWLQYIKVKSELVLFRTKAIQANGIGPVQKYEVLDAMSDSLVKLYYLQQKLESFFDIPESNINFAELEAIIKSYTELLTPSNDINSAWKSKEDILISRLNTLQPKLYKELKGLNPL
ncbi:hypothetical protein Acal02_01671 [Acinetobacter calcoaceticus]